MNQRLLWVFALLVITSSAFSQKNAEPTETDKANSTKLKALFPDDHVALQSKTDHVTFDFNKKDQKVTVLHQTDEDFINMDSRSDIQMYAVYDGESTIKTFDILLKSGKSAGFYIQDEAYKSADLFHIDTRVKYTNVDFPLKGYRY